MYENKYAVSGSDHLWTTTEAYSVNINLRNTNTFYWLADTYPSYKYAYLYCVYNDGNIFITAHLCGVRPTITLKSDIKLATYPGDDHHSAETAWEIVD